MAPDRGTPPVTPDPLTPELAPFVALARARLEQDTSGLDHDSVVEHLEAAVARASLQASRLGFVFPGPEAPDRAVDDAIPLGDGSVVVVQHIADPTGG
jgi:hypothetical protein